MRPSRRRLAFLLLLIVCVGVPALYVLRVRRPLPPAPPSVTESGPRLPAPETPPEPRPPAHPRAPRPSPAPRVAQQVPRRLPSHATPPPAPPRALFRYTGLGEHYGQLVWTTLAEPPPPVTATPLVCDRVHFAAGSGICLTHQSGTLPSQEALLFDGEFRVRQHIPLTGFPSRARVSPDGKLASFTVFQSGHSYAENNFSTRVSIVDAVSGAPVAPDLEQFAVIRDGVPFKAPDFNFWGVTFAHESGRFYATLMTGGRIYLVEGDLATRQARIVREGIECPSLSPDDTRLAFKKRTSGAYSRLIWRITVLNLSTGEERETSETRSVDDQVLWLDNHSILYALPEALSGSAAMNTWVVPADGSGEPRLFMSKAYSLVVIPGIK